MSDEDRYWSVRLIVYAFESEDEAREYQHKLVDAFCAMPESADLASTAGYFEGSSFDEIARLRAEVERLKNDLAFAHASRLSAEDALADERAHADALMDDVRQRLSYDAETFHDQGAWDREDACLAIMKRIDLHRARRQG